jgi:KaiC/GvpD/RAD55 family RecA-like ATPase
LKQDDEVLNGVPMVGQIGIVGLPDSGKSVLVQEIALRVASGGQKVLFVTSEDIWESPTPRFDLQSRMKEKADIMGLNWETIKQNLFVFDTITHAEFRDWNTFVDAYRYLVEAEKGIDLLIVDSITLMESYRGALKFRLMELARYNQLHGITAFYVCQRAIEDVNKYAMAGGIGLAHNLDITICLDHGKVWGSQMKLDLNLHRDKDHQLKQGAWVNFIRVMGCRLCNFQRLHFEIEITKQGFVRPKQ